jgi:hypothetical protein
MACWNVATTAGTFSLHAPTAAAAITSALELAGPGAQVLQVSREGEW